MARHKNDGGGRRGGRQKGTPNKRTQDLQAKAEELGVDPFEILLLIAGNKWDKLGYSSPTVTKVLKDGGTLECDRIELVDRLSAAEKVSQYLYPKLKSIEHSQDKENPLFVPLSRAEILGALRSDPFLKKAE